MPKIGPQFETLGPFRDERYDGAERPFSQRFERSMPTFRDSDNFALKATPPAPENKLPITKLPTAMAAHQGNRITTAKFFGPLFGPAGPQVSDINQGQAGSCYLLSTLAALAIHDPQVIRDLIKDNGDGTFTVRLFQQVDGVPVPGAPPLLIRIDSELHVDISVNHKGQPFAYSTTYATSMPYATFSSSLSAMTEQAMWVPLLEKAFAAYRGGSYDNMGQRGWSHEAMAAILGRPAVRTRISQLGLAATFAMLKTAERTLSPVTLATNTDPDKISMFTNTGYVPGHAYTFVGVSERGGQKFVTVRNPWGHVEPSNNSPDDGTFEISLEELGAFFEIIGSAPKSAATGKSTLPTSVRSLL